MKHSSATRLARGLAGIGLLISVSDAASQIDAARLPSAFSLNEMAYSSGDFSAQPIDAKDSFSPTPTPAKDAEVNEASIDKLLSAVKPAIDNGTLAAAAVAVVKVTEGQADVVLPYAFGYPDIWHKDRLADKDSTLFRVASMSKLVTATAVMQLVEQGRLGLEDEVNSHLKAFQIPDTFPGHPVRLKHLLTHTGGFETNMIGYYLAGRAEHDLPLAQWLGGHIPDRIWPPADDFQDVRDAAYSDWGMAVAGLLVQEVSGQAFEAYAKEHVLDRCGMTHSTFSERLDSPELKNLAMGYRYENFHLVPQGFERFSPIAPAASLSTSAGDMAKFMLAHLKQGVCPNGNQLLEPATLQLMQSRIASQHPQTNGFGYGFFETAINGYRTIGHSGKSPSFSSTLVLVPEKGLGFFAVFSTDPVPARLPSADSFMASFASGKPPAISAPADFNARAKQYEGFYSSTRRSYHGLGAYLAFLLSGEEVKATGNNTLFYHGADWYEVQPDVFVPISGRQVIAFKRNTKGDITHIVGPLFPDPQERLGAAETAMYYATSLVLVVQQTASGFLGTPPLSWAVLIVGGVVLLFAFAPRLAAASKPLPAARWLLVGIGLCGLAILAALVQTIADIAFRLQGLLEHIPWYLAAVPWLSKLTLILTLLATTCAVLAWRKRYWTLYGRIEYTLIVLLAMLFLDWLLRWNLL